VAVGTDQIGGNGLTVFASEAITNLFINLFPQTLTETYNFTSTGIPVPATATLDYTFFPYAIATPLDPALVGVSLPINFFAYVNGNPGDVIVNDPNAGFFNSATPQSGEHVVDTYHPVEFPFPVNSITIVLTIGTPNYFSDGLGIGNPDPELDLNNSAYAQVTSPEPASLTIFAPSLLGLAIMVLRRKAAWSLRFSNSTAFLAGVAPRHLFGQQYHDCPGDIALLPARVPRASE
jgi:hypothetical protein